MHINSGLRARALPPSVLLYHVSVTHFLLKCLHYCKKVSLGFCHTSVDSGRLCFSNACGFFLFYLLGLYFLYVKPQNFYQNGSNTARSAQHDPPQTCA